MCMRISILIFVLLLPSLAAADKLRVLTPWNVICWNNDDDGARECGASHSVIKYLEPGGYAGLIVGLPPKKSNYISVQIISEWPWRRIDVRVDKFKTRKLTKCAVDDHCVASEKVSAAIISEMTIGKSMWIRVYHRNSGAAMDIPISLAGFAEAAENARLQSAK